MDLITENLQVVSFTASDTMVNFTVGVAFWPRFIANQYTTARALHRHLEWHYHENPWPSLTLSAVDLTYHLMKRINEASVSRVARHRN